MGASVQQRLILPHASTWTAGTRGSAGLATSAGLLGPKLDSGPRRAYRAVCLSSLRRLPAIFLTICTAASGDPGGVTWKVCGGRAEVQADLRGPPYDRRPATADLKVRNDEESGGGGDGNAAQNPVARPRRVLGRRQSAADRCRGRSYAGERRPEACRAPSVPASRVRRAGRSSSSRPALFRPDPCRRARRARFRRSVPRRPGWPGRDR